MTTQKAQRKIKSSTVAITVLSILLAIAVVSTIVLAAFSANKKATTTITFGSGLQITATGIYISGEADTGTSGQSFAWGVTADGSLNKTGTVTDVANSAVFEEIKISVTTPASGTAYVIAKATISESGGKTPSLPTVQYGSGWIELSDGWYIYGTNVTGGSEALTTVSSEITCVQSATITVDDKFIGSTVTGTFQLYAVDATAYTAGSTGYAQAIDDLEELAGIGA